MTPKRALQQTAGRNPARPPLQVYGTRSLRPLEELVTATESTIASMWASAGGGAYRLSAHYPLVAMVNLCRRLNPASGLVRPSMDVHCVVIGHWQVHDPSKLRLGCLWLSEAVPKLRDLRLKEFHIEDDELRRYLLTWGPKSPAFMALALRLAEETAGAKMNDNVYPAFISKDGWRYAGVPTTGIRAWFFPPGSAKARMALMPTARSIMAPYGGDNGYPRLTPHSPAEADRESLFWDQGFIKALFKDLPEVRNG